MQNKTSGSKIMSKLYRFLPFLLLDQEFHHALGPLSYPSVQDLLGILGDLKKNTFQREDSVPISGLTCQMWVILVKVFHCQTVAKFTVKTMRRLIQSWALSLWNV